MLVYVMLIEHQVEFKIPTILNSPTNKEDSAVFLFVWVNTTHGD